MKVTKRRKFPKYHIMPINNSDRLLQEALGQVGQPAAPDKNKEDAISLWLDASTSGNSVEKHIGVWKTELVQEISPEAAAMAQALERRYPDAWTTLIQLATKHLEM